MRSIPAANVPMAANAGCWMWSTSRETLLKRVGKTPQTASKAE